MPSMRELGSRRLMANPCAGDKCARATAAMRALIDPNPPPAGQGEVKAGKRNHFGFAAASFAVFLHSDMNFLRSLPWTPLVSASFEHSREAAVRGFSAFLSAGAIFVAGAGVAGAVACANAEPIRSRDATAVATAREDIVIMGNTSD